MKKSAYQWGAAGLLWAGFIGLAAAQNLPRLGEDGLMPLSDELRIGVDVARSLYSQPDYVDDPLLVEYVDGIFSRLMAAGRADGSVDPAMARFPWRVLQGADTTVNAFAVPGGVLGLHLATIGVTDRADELASVLAHEVSHVTQRHIARLQVKQQRLQPVMIGSLILGAIAAGKNTDLGNAVMMGGQGLAAQQQLAFSRDMEREADRMGMGLLQQAGYNTGGFAGMFEKLQNANRINDDGSYPYLRSHPLTTERIADMRMRAPADTLKSAPPDLRHLLMAARARALATSRVDAWRTMQKQALAQLQTPAGTAPERMAVLYQGAVASLRLQDAPAAQQLQQALQRVVTGIKTHAGQSLAQRQQSEQVQRVLRLLDADIASSQGRWAQVASDSQAAAPLYRPEFLLYQQALLNTNKAADARSQLQTWVADHADDAPAWLLLAQTYGRLGQGAQMARAQGEAAYAEFDYAMALQYLKSARQLTGADLYEGSILDARIRQVQAVQKDMDEKLIGN
jgi:predicted Zn-dependent protease